MFLKGFRACARLIGPVELFFDDGRAEEVAESPDELTNRRVAEGIADSL